jgi:hypothetical protein
MNERIKELRNLAWKDVYNVDPADPRVAKAHAYMEEGMTRFAELIVRECMSLASECSGKVHPDDLNEIFKEHFGVK